MDNYLTISQLNKYIKNVLEKDSNLVDIYVCGEVSNLKIHQSGHWYFTLKDDQSRINAVMFFSYAAKVDEKIHDGMKVVVKATIGVYEVAGSYQLLVKSIQTIGLGNLHLKFEKLKTSLQQEGLFDELKKCKIPKFPTSIGVISAPKGAAIKDVITAIKRRWPITQIVLIPTLVQGKDSAESIVQSLFKADEMKFDTIILTRGGGSIEDLWSFNEEMVARAISMCKTPIICGVGHDIDYTIADFVADLRAPTPTAAGELATPNFVEVLKILQDSKTRLFNAFQNNIVAKKEKLQNLSSSKVLIDPMQALITKRLTLDATTQKLISLQQRIITLTSTKIKDQMIKMNQALTAYVHLKRFAIIEIKDKIKIDKNIYHYQTALETYKNKIMYLMVQKKNMETIRYKELTSKLSILSPLKTIERGYSIIYQPLGNILTSVKQINIGDEIKIKLVDGEVKANISKVEENSNGKI